MTTRPLYDVVVIGCGASGLAALTKLYQSGFSVLGLEANSKIGGRIQSLQYGNAHIDLGAEFCHGYEDNVVYSLAKDHNVVCDPKQDFISQFIDSKGHLISQELNDQMNQLYFEVPVEALEEMKTSSESVGKHYTETYFKLLKSGKYDKIPENMGVQLLEWIEKFENSLESSDNWFEPSAKGLLEYWLCDGPNVAYWKENGFSTILNIMLKKYPNPKDELPVDILLNKEVVNIEWNGPYAKIRCSDKTFYTSKHVIVTVSLGVLKERVNYLFTPQLPQGKVRAIEGLSIGTVNKMFLKYKKRWWSPSTDWFGFLWSEEEKNKVPLEEKWIIDVFGCHSPESNDSVLCFWITGPSSRYVETLPDEKVRKCLDRLAKQFLGKAFEYNESIDMIRSKWYTNPFTRGSYSFRSMNTEKLLTGQNALAMPVSNFEGKPIICFGGEATSTHYYSTVHGAIEAGYREADRIVNFAKTEKLPSHF